MKTYEKMKAAIVDISNVLDEALAFEQFRKTNLQPAFAGNVGGNIRMMNDVTTRPGSTRGVRATPMPIDEPALAEGNYVTIEVS